MLSVVERIKEKLGLLGRRLPYGEAFDRLNKNSIAIDCGANVGKVTARMARQGAAVYAFEPNPHAFAVLRKRFKNNPAVTCIPKAVWTRPDTVKLYFHEQSSQDEVTWSVGSSMVPAKSNIDANKYIDVETVDLPAFIDGLGRSVDILKIDIEGAECEVIEALIDRGTYKKVGLILVETHDHKVPQLKAATDHVRERIANLGIGNIRLDWI